MVHEGLALAIYVSTSIAGDIADRLGATHYSYHFAAELFRDMLERHGHPARHLPMPEIYASAAALDGPAGPHLIFRSTEQVRLLKPASANICCFPWEFPVLKSDTLPGEHPFLNQVRMLTLCDEVWTPSAYGRDVLRAHGVANVHLIPAPVAIPGRRASRAEALRALAGLPCVGLRANFCWSAAHATALAEASLGTLGEAIARHGVGGRAPAIYLSILNPEDSRKNIDPLLRGFHRFRARHPNAVLIVKALTAAARFTLPRIMGDVVPRKLASGTVIEDDGIVVINAYLSVAHMSLLYALADGYVCTSLGEGQNLPLLEAMAHGTPAITTRNTAMDDYVDPATAVIIEAATVTNDDTLLAGTIARGAFEVSRCGAQDVCDALCIAHTVPRAVRTARVAAGRAVVEAGYSDAAVWLRVAGRLAHHAA